MDWILFSHISNRSMIINFTSEIRLIEKYAYLKIRGGEKEEKNGKGEREARAVFKNKWFCYYKQGINLKKEFELGKLQ